MAERRQLRGTGFVFIFVPAHVPKQLKMAMKFFEKFEKLDYETQVVLGMCAALLLGLLVFFVVVHFAAQVKP